MIYLYAITNCPHAALPALNGLADSTLVSLPYREIAAVVSVVPSTIASSEANLWQHEAVVEALMAERTVLPVRFGTILRDETAIQTSLQEHYVNFTANLERLHDRVELSVRVVWEEASNDSAADPAAPVATSGRAYMLERLVAMQRGQAQREQAEQLATTLHTVLARLAVAHTRRVLATPRLLLSGAYLVERRQVDAFQEEVQRLGLAHPDLHVLCTGPWPAYHFVTMEYSNDLT